VKFAPGKIPPGARAPENVYIVYQPRRRRKIETTGQKYNGVRYYIGRP